MPLFSDLSSLSMYYSGSSPSSATYNPYTTATGSPGASYSSSYLSSGGNYSNHSSLGGYSRAPLTPRWVPTGRTYSPLLTTISERGNASPVRVNSPRRLLLSSQYSPANYVPRPININTADIDVSRERYRVRPVTAVASHAPVSDVTKYSGNTAPKDEPLKTSAPSAPSDDLPKSSVTPSSVSADEGPFMPRIDGKTGSGDDNSPGLQRSTIRRGRTVVRLHTLKRKERDSPRKSQDELENAETSDGMSGSNKNSPKGSGWREKLSEDLIYKDKRERKTPGEKLIEKFILKEKTEDELPISRKSSPNSENVTSKDHMLQPKEVEAIKPPGNKSPDRRCSMEMLAEQANVLDTLIREENLSTTCLDLSKIGTKGKTPLKEQAIFGSCKKRKSIRASENRLLTTKSDHALHERVQSLGARRDKQSISRNSSLKKSVSGGNICRLDSIIELSKEPLHLASIDENRISLKVDKMPTKLKQKTKITSTVEVSQSQSPLKARVENITVERILREPKKDINFSCVVEANIADIQSTMESTTPKRKSPEHIKDSDRTDNTPSKQSKSIRKLPTSLPDNEDVEGDDCNFWDKIGKRETVYLKNRRLQLQNELLQSRRAIYWYPEHEDGENGTNEDTEQTIASSSIEKHSIKESVNQDCKTDPTLTDEKVELKLKADLEFKSNNELKSTIGTSNINSTDKIINEFPEHINELNINEQVPKLQDKVAETNVDNTTSKKDIVTLNTNSNIVPHIEPVNIKAKDIVNIINKSNDETNCMLNTTKNKILIDEVQQLHYDNKHESISEHDINNINQDSSDRCQDLSEPLVHSKTTIGKSELSELQDKHIDIEIPSNELKNEDDIGLGKKTEIATSKDSSVSNKSDIVPESGSFIKDSKDINNEIPEISPNDAQSGIQVEPSFTSICTKDIPEPKDSKSSDEKNNIPLPYLDASNKSSSLSKEGEGSKSDNEKDSSNNIIKLPTSPMRKPIKDEPMVRPLIATPRPLQKRAPQVIHSSSSSETSSDDDSDDEADESSDSEGSTEFYECENPGQDGRTSTGSNDSGFDSSAPTSPAGFVCVKKECDVNCHRKCEKLTANLCGVNQRLLVEALARTASRRGGDSAGASTSTPQPSSGTLDSAEAGLEASTAYGVFRRTGRVTPPAKSIPRFRKYTMEDFHFLKVLGKGSFGKVLLAELRDTEYYYAVKCLKKDVVLEDDDVECTLIERKVLALGTNHPYLCHLFATFQTDSHLFFVMEYLNGGDLMFHIQQSGRFPEPRAKFYAAEIVSGLKFLHKRGIVYRDLKLDNILLDYEGHVRIADFGMCKLQIYLEKTADTFCGTPDYMAPEIIKGLKYNQTVDWWSFGVLLYEMLIGQSPFSGCDEDELFWSICNELPSYPRFLSHEAHTILIRLLDKDARTRLGGTDCMHGDVRDQDFFHSIQWDRLDRRELEAPFRPRVRHPYDTQYFDRAFTGERPRLTAVEPNVLRTMDQQPFRGFSYTNPNATDR